MALASAAAASASPLSPGGSTWRSPRSLDEVRAAVLVEELDHVATGQHGRGARAVFGLRQRHRSSPEFLSIEVVGQDADRPEVDVDPFFVGDRGGGGGIAERLVDLLDLLRDDLAPPDLAAGTAVDREREQLPLGEGGEEDAAAPNDGRGVAGGNFDAPRDIRGGTEDQGRPGIGGTETEAARTPELRPIAVAIAGHRERERRERQAGEEGRDGAERAGVHGLMKASLAARGKRASRPGCDREGRSVEVV